MLHCIAKASAALQRTASVGVRVTKVVGTCPTNVDTIVGRVKHQNTSKGHVMRRLVEEMDVYSLLCCSPRALMLSELARSAVAHSSTCACSRESTRFSGPTLMDSVHRSETSALCGQTLQSAVKRRPATLLKYDLNMPFFLRTRFRL